MIKTLNQFFKTLLISKWLPAEISTLPIYFFFFVGASHLGLITFSLFRAMLVIWATVFFIGAGCNYLLFYTGRNNDSEPFLKVFNLAGILKMNQVWRVHLYIYSLGHCLAGLNEKFLVIYSVFASAYMLTSIYQKMYFEQISHNYYFFIGFFSLASLSLLEFVLETAFTV